MRQEQLVVTLQSPGHIQRRPLCMELCSTLWISGSCKTPAVTQQQPRKPPSHEQRGTRAGVMPECAESLKPSPEGT